MSFVLFFSNCIHSQEEEPPHFDEQELLALTQEFQGTFDDEGVELLHKSNLDESIHSFLEVYHEIYSDLSNDPENVVLKNHENKYKQ